MHTITNCSRCGNDFMYHNSDYHLERDITIVDEVGNNEVITVREFNSRLQKEYPIQDETWSSRRWNKERTDYVDLSGETTVICQDCDYVETYGNGVLKDYEIKNYSDYKKVVEEMWQHGDLNELTEAGFIVVDTREYRDNGTVSKETLRVLTEKEFYARFVEPTSDQDLLPLEDRGEWETGGVIYLTDEELNEELPF